jgi:hypothetical protein
VPSRTRRMNDTSVPAGMETQSWIGLFSVMFRKNAHVSAGRYANLRTSGPSVS